MKNIKSFEQFDFNDEEINEGLFSGDYKNAMKKWKAAFGYYYENGKGKSFMKSMINGLKDEFKSNKKFLGTIINTFNQIKKAKNGKIGGSHNGLAGSSIKKQMPHIDDVAKNYGNDSHYYDDKAVEMIKDAGLELSDEDKKILDLNVQSQGQGQKAQGQGQKIQGQVQESKIILSFNDF